MFAILFKFSIAFTVSFLILSFKINHKQLFYHLSEFTGPLGTEVQTSIKKSVKNTMGKTKKLGAELFKNADPVYVNDKVKKKQSSVTKKQNQTILEKLERDEIRKLDELIKKN